MARIKDIKQAIENKGFKTDFIKAENTKHKISNFIGFTSNGTVWYWFCEDTITHSPYAFFDHRYNQGNGSIIRTYKQEQKALELLELNY